MTSFTANAKHTISTNDKVSIFHKFANHLEKTAEIFAPGYLVMSGSYYRPPYKKQ